MFVICNKMLTGFFKQDAELLLGLFWIIVIFNLQQTHDKLIHIYAYRTNLIKQEFAIMIAQDVIFQLEISLHNNNNLRFPYVYYLNISICHCVRII